MRTKTNKTFSGLPIDNQPVYLTASGELAKMNADEEMTWSAGQKTKVFCSGPDNSVSLRLDRDITEIECVAGKKFKVAGHEINFENIMCAKKITADVQDDHKKCGNGTGYSFNVGFKGRGSTFVTFIRSCYRNSTGSVLFTRHPLHGDAVSTGCANESRHDFRSDGTVPQCANLTKYFVLQNQQKRFTRASEALGRRFNDNDRLDRGHLTPYCDGIFLTWKQATQFYINTAPEWKSINAANWRTVENMARGIAKELKKTLDIFTGTFGILNVDNVDMKLMDNGFVEVPKWFWKIIRDPATDHGIALVTLNNIFAIREPTICQDICEATNWDHENFNDYQRGFTYCCDVNSLRNVVHHIPAEVSARYTLMYPTTRPTKRRRPGE